MAGAEAYPCSMSSGCRGMKPGSMRAVVRSRAMLAAAMTAATTTGAGVKGSIRRHEITAWNSAAQARTCYAVLFCR